MASVSARTFAEIAQLNQFSALAAYESNRPALRQQDFRLRGYGDDTTDDSGSSWLDSVTSITKSLATVATPIITAATGQTLPSKTGVGPGYVPPATSSSSTTLMLGLGVFAIAAFVIMGKK